MAGTPRDIATLESWFETGDKPTQQQFYDLFASMLHYTRLKQVTGASTTDIMSQRAVSDALAAISTTLSAVLTTGNDAGAQQIKNLLNPTLAQDADTLAARNSAINTAIATLLDGVAAPGDTLSKLYDLINGLGSGGSGASDTDALPEGSTNLYFTTARVLATVITGFASGAGVVASTDTLLQALNKIVGNIALKQDALGFTPEDVANKATGTGALANSDTTYPSEKKVKANNDLKAPLASPALIGTPTSTTPAANDNSTKIATTAYVDNQTIVANDYVSAIASISHFKL